MKKIIIACLVLAITGCFGPPKFDSSNQDSAKKSASKIINTLPEAEKEEFGKALLYFSMGGESGFKSLMKPAFVSKSDDVSREAILTDNLKVIDGLTGQQILEMYRVRQEEDRISREKQKAKKEEERKKQEEERAKKQAEREKVAALKAEAEKLLRSDSFEEALVKYRALSEIPSGLDAAEQGIEATTKAMEKLSAEMSYIDKIEITEFQARRIDTNREKDIPAVRISLKNNGDRSLDKVKVIVYFQDKNGNTIYEEDFHPVFVTKYSFSGNDKPLKPGYIKEMERDKFYTLDTALSAWAEGKAIAKVTEIKFSD